MGQMRAEFISHLTDVIRSAADNTSEIERECASLEFVDAMGCVVLGAGHPVVRRTAEHLRTWPGSGPISPVASLQQKMSLDKAILLDSMACHIDEFDSIHPASATVPASVVIPAAFSLAAYKGASGELLVHAILAGYAALIETSEGFGGPDLYAGGLWPTAVFGSISAAASASVLLELNSYQTANAIAIASACLGGLLSEDKLAEGHYLLAGNAAARGVEAAFQALAGMEASLSLLDGPAARALRRRPTPPPHAAARWIRGCSIKAYPCARPLHAVLDGVKTLCNQGLELGDIARVDIRLPLPLLNFVSTHTQVDGPTEAAASAVFALAGLMAGRDHDPQFFRAARLGIHDRVPHVTLEADDELTAAFPTIWNAKVRITDVRGHVFEVKGPARTGTNSWEFVSDKFQRNISPDGGRLDVMQSWLHDAQDLDSVASISQLKSDFFQLLA